jgi:hypothetical protein
MKIFRHNGIQPVQPYTDLCHKESKNIEMKLGNKSEDLDTQDLV